MNLFSQLQSLYWREPLFLLLALQPVVVYLLKKIIQTNNDALFVEKQLHAWVFIPSKSAFKDQLFSKNTLYVIAWLLFSIALAGPRTPVYQADKTPLLGANIMFVVDLSPSMQATDIIPNRLRRAKIELYEFLENAKQHRVGITVFSARPHIYVPLTSDYSVLKTYIQSLDQLELPTLGSSPAAAILLAEKALAEVKGKSAIVLITDGDFSNSKENKEYANLNRLKKHNIPLYVLGVGTVEGEAIPLKDGSWLQYKQQAVVSQMNEHQLQQLAGDFGGKYSAVSDNASDWQYLYANGIAQHKDAVEVDAKQHIIWDELFAYFLIPSIVLFWFSLSRLQFNVAKNSITFFIVFIALSLVPDQQAHAFELFDSNEQTAYSAYQNHDYALAESLYKDVEGYTGYFGQGNSLYKQGHYQEAIQQFTFAVLNANTDDKRVAALYNLANSYFRSGEFSLAITVYQDVLRYQPEHKASLYNLNVSQVLKENIEKRAKENEWVVAIQQGRGVRSASVADGTEINENTTVSMGGSENKKKETIPLPDLPDISEDALVTLLTAGLKNIQLAEESKSSQSEQQQAELHTNSQTATKIDLIRAQQKSNAMTDAQHLLWKRVFEIEEGFPAPVEKPYTLPGVNPW